MASVSGFRCYCGRHYGHRPVLRRHQHGCPAARKNHCRDLLCLLSCLSRESIPGHILFRAAFPTKWWNKSGGSDSYRAFPLPGFVTDFVALNSTITSLVEGRTPVLYLAAWAEAVDPSGPSWASRNLTFHADAQAFILRNLSSEQSMFRGSYEFWRFEAMKLVFHSFPYPSDPL
jgi:hypothetical protein